MWVVAQEDYDLTLVDFALLVESDRLEGAAHMDRQYHLAKLVAAAFNDPERIWTEHEEYRAALIRQPTPQLNDDLMRRAAALFKRARAAEARHGAH